MTNVTYTILRTRNTRASTMPPFLVCASDKVALKMVQEPSTVSFANISANLLANLAGNQRPRRLQFLKEEKN